MPRAMNRLPPIATEDRSEKISLSLPADLRNDIDHFGEYFADATGQRPTSFNAIAVGILTAYLNAHTGYRKWRRENGPPTQRTEADAA